MSVKTPKSSFDNEAGKGYGTHVEKAGSSLASELEDQVSNDPYAVTLDSHEDPKNLSSWRKWSIVLILASGAHCTACVSAMVSTCGSLSTTAPMKTVAMLCRLHSRRKL